MTHENRTNGSAKVLFLLCWLVYFASYLGRLNYTSVMPEMIGAGLLTKPQAGMLGTAYLIFYAAGQIVSGMLGDRFSPIKLIALGTLCSAAANALFGLCSTFPLMVLLRCAIGFFSSMLWPPILRLFADRMNAQDRVNYSIHMTSAVAAGTLGAYLLAALMLALGGWRAAFHGAAALMAALGLLWLHHFRGDSGAAPAKSTNQPIGNQPEAALPFGRMLLIPGILACLYPVIAHGLFYRCWDFRQVRL